MHCEPAILYAGVEFDAGVEVPAVTLKQYMSHWLAVVVCVGAVAPNSTPSQVTAPEVTAPLQSQTRRTLPQYFVVVALTNVMVVADEPSMYSACWRMEIQLMTIEVEVEVVAAGVKMPPVLSMPKIRPLPFAVDEPMVKAGTVIPLG